MNINLKAMKASATRALSLAQLTLKEKQPEIYLALGIIGGVTAAVMACKATTKAVKVIEEHNKEMEAIHICSTDEKYKDKYSEEMKNKDLVKRYSHTAFDMARLYGPSIIVGTASVVSLMTSHNIQKQRNAALVTTLAAVQANFNEYRKNVGKADKSLETEALFNEEVVEKSEDGKITLKGDDEHIYSNMHSLYARIYDPDKLPRRSYGLLSDMAFVEMKQRELNDRLRANGYLFLNDAYDAFDFPPTVEGQTVGWIFDLNDADRDNFVDLGATVIDQVDKYGEIKKKILMDFNVDGPIIGELANRNLLRKI